MGLLLVVAVITVPGWIPAFPKTLSTAGSWLSVAGMFLIAALFSALGIKLMGDRLRGFIPSFAAIFVLSAGESHLGNPTVLRISSPRITEKKTDSSPAVLMGGSIETY